MSFSDRQTLIPSFITHSYTNRCISPTYWQNWCHFIAIVPGIHSFLTEHSYSNSSRSPTFPEWLVGSYLSHSSIVPTVQGFWIVDHIEEEKGEWLRDRLIKELDSRPWSTQIRKQFQIEAKSKRPRVLRNVCSQIMKELQTSAANRGEGPGLNMLPMFRDVKAEASWLTENRAGEGWAGLKSDACHANSAAIWKRHRMVNLGSDEDQQDNIFQGMRRESARTRQGA
jgi:hypothetical protein